MNELMIGYWTALWFGILTSISPCPLATNIAAVSFIGKQNERKGNVVFSGLSYTAGRMLSYIVLGTIIMNSILRAPTLARFLQNSLNQWIGPVLILIGLILLEVFPMFSTGWMPGMSLQKRLAGKGFIGALFLGILFALSMCPVSAALFFGSLIPLSIEHNSTLILPMLYGLGTALPVIFIAFVLFYSARSVGKIFNVMSKLETWGRKITGILFILIGIYFCYRYLI